MKKLVYLLLGTAFGALSVNTLINKETLIPIHVKELDD